MTKKGGWRSLLPFQDGAEEAVHAMAMSLGPEETPAVDEGRIYRVRRSLHVEFAMAGEKIVYHLLVFLGTDGAGAVDQNTSPSQPQGCPLKDRALQVGEALDIIRADAPFDLGISPEGAESGAGGIDKDPVEAFPKVFSHDGRCVSSHRSCDGYAEPFHELSEKSELPPVPVHRKDASPVFHERREVSRLSSRTRAGVENRLARSGIDEKCCEL